MDENGSRGAARLSTSTTGKLASGLRGRVGTTALRPESSSEPFRASLLLVWRRLRGGARSPAARNRRGAAVRVRGGAEAEPAHDLHGLRERLDGALNGRRPPVAHRGVPRRRRAGVRDQAQGGTRAVPPLATRPQVGTAACDATAVHLLEASVDRAIIARDRAPRARRHLAPGEIDQDRPVPAEQPQQVGDLRRRVLYTAATQLPT